VRGLLTAVVQETHELDPTRPAAIGGAQRGDVDKLGDVAGYNGDGARLFMKPGIPSVVSEYGAVLKFRPGNYDPYFGALQTEEFPWRSGQAIWCGFDHGSIGGFSRGQKGIIDYFRLPKESWYWYRNEYLHIPPPDWPQEGTPAKLQLTASNTTIKGTDATDDCQLVVTVLDASGKPISNSPPVTLKIEKGPGEFPTGPAITFDAGTDIGIRDGTAAIDFRSYYAGTSTIRATSPGLQDATIDITITGDPVFVPGQTPVVADRPYHAFHNANIKSDPNANLAEDRPTDASSEAPDHSGRLANDGASATYWSPADNSPGAWWQLDLEQIAELTRIKTNFGVKQNYQYKIEVSDDGTSWTTSVDQTSSTATDKSRTDAFPSGTHGRYVKITFTGASGGAPPQICEVEVNGKPPAQ